MMTTIKPFTIGFLQPQLDNLRERLRQTIWPTTIESRDYGGPPLGRMKALVGAAAAFEWRTKEADLNALPQFVTEIDGQTIHFIHVRSKQPGAIPLLLIHGWPGSFVEFLDHVRPLTAPDGDGGKAPQAFDVVIPSLPGFALSGPTKDVGWNNVRMGRALFELMHRLGYDKFGIQGGDAGAIIGPEMGRLAPERVIGIHVNAATVGFIPMGPVAAADIATFTEAEKRRLAVMQQYLQARFGYNVVQSHQPQLLAYALADSPAGLMAWMTQLMDPDEVGDERFLTNVLLYWLTGTSGSSIRLYYENGHEPGAWAPKTSSGVPTAVAVFGDEDVAIRRYGEAGNRIVRWTEFATGGHYAVMTAPQEWLADVRQSFREMVT
jgi:epoxide hydrolase